ncbi:hypothetical protein A8C56_15685 [Niabella ginsenosidivorans]|uniref:Uncharacterized protein n=1 Tax=Niabella ginsenosidivorans TaxID=1176587 RepID=A0A1A9I6C8_9BACT|nr:hypothetical protein A8C56_15685 [Niabella ginsenosidivorans]
MFGVFQGLLLFQGPGERSIDAETIPNYRNGMTKRKIDFQNNNTSVIGNPPRQNDFVGLACRSDGPDEG